MLARFPKYFGTDASYSCMSEKLHDRRIKTYNILMEVVIKNCSDCLMDLPVAWLQVTQVAPTSSPNQDVSHPGILSIFTLSTDSPYPVMGCLQLTFTKTQEKSKHQFGVTSSPLPGYLLARLNFVEIQDSLPKHENLGEKCQKRGSNPQQHIFFKAMRAWKFFTWKSRLPCQFPHLQKIWRRFSSPARWFGGIPHSSAFPLGKSGLSFWEVLFKAQGIDFCLRLVSGILNFKSI